MSYTARTRWLAVRDEGIDLDARHPSGGPPSGGTPTSDRLDSWKAISDFLHRDIRTVQRWEATEGLPVYRHKHSKQGSVYAYRSELEAWWRNRPPSSRVRSTETDALPKATHHPFEISYIQLAMYGALIVALALSIGWAKQIFFSPGRVPATTIPVKTLTIAVLPFHGVSTTSQDSNLALSLTENVINGFQQSKTLRVVDQSLVMPFESSDDSAQHIAQLLHSDRLLRGTASDMRGSIQVKAELIDAATGRTIWSSQFEHNEADLLEDEKEIAQEITADVENTLGVRAAPKK
jgi:TolB-like protein